LAGASGKGISNRPGLGISRLSAQKKMRVPGSARAGIGLLIFGAILVGLGQYWERESLSLYGLIVAAAGFGLYMISSVVAKRKFRG